MTRPFSDGKELMLYFESKLITEGKVIIPAQPVQKMFVRGRPKNLKGKCEMEKLFINDDSLKLAK